MASPACGSILNSCCIFRRSSSGSRRQFSIDKNDLQRGSDAADAPLPLEQDGAAEEHDLVIGGEQGDGSEGDATERLEQPEAVKAQPAAG